MPLKIVYLLIISILTLLVGWLAARRLRKLQEKRTERIRTTDIPESLPQYDTPKNIKRKQISRLESRFSITRWSVLLSIFGFGATVALLPFIRHISPTLLPVIMGVTSVIIGIAAKPFIENMICGMVLCYSKLARIGDTALVDDAYGVIEDVTLTHCIIKRWDSLRYVVPNSSMMTKEFVNYSLNDNERWVIVEFWIDYAADIEAVEAIAVETPKESEYFANTEEPRFWVVETAQQAVKCMITAWATSPAEGWMLGHDIRKALLPELKKHNIHTHQYRLNTSGF
ncbi:mechanosensitive ion channel [Pontiellaceae bacterium B12219]|nr:mechanosensitive ion channel [Pontiellaceae bacterium B12219]